MGILDIAPRQYLHLPPFLPEIQDMGYAPYASVSTYPPLQPQI